MPVASQATVKGLTPGMVRGTGTQMILANTYHLTLRPGVEVIAELGGIHKFMGWEGPLLTDSGGYQLYSLATNTQIGEQGAVFRSHIDGRLLELSPERVVQLQETLGSDVAMVLDHVVPLPSPEEAVHDACERTVRWARRCRDAARRPDQALFAIVQGGLDAELRVSCAARLVEMEFAGYAIGGLSVGEDAADRNRVLDLVCPVLPVDQPRYLMGVGTPQDVLDAIRRGVDMLDCVMPTRNGRNALAFTDRGPLRMRNLVHARDPRPIQEGCPCPACRHSRGYVRHLFQAGEMLGPMLVSAHNVTYYQLLLAGAREAIRSDAFVAYYEAKLRGWSRGDSEECLA